MPFEKTYTMADAPPPAWRWEDYSAWVEIEYAKLVSSEAAREERNLQVFLEQHPCLVPGLHYSNKIPYPGALISQPRLSGVGLKVPDFLWIGFDSGTIYPTLVEIETPYKRWYTADGNMHSDFTSAYNQLKQWAAWLGRTANRQVFVDMFRIPSDLLLDRRFRPKFILVHGSRSEIESRRELNALRAQYNDVDIEVATFDRLSPQHDAWCLWCVKNEESGFRAVSLPPTYKMGPFDAEDVSLFKEREAAIESNALLSAERKKFLIDRLAYWDAWAKTSKKGVRFSGDWE
jgi:hypothetical protein